MSRLYLRKSEIGLTYAVSTWQSVLFAEFEAQMCSEARPFPCAFGVTGYRQDQLRYLFLDPFEYRQYFLMDDNQAQAGCPFAKLAHGETPVGPSTSQVEHREQAA